MLGVCLLVLLACAGRGLAAEFVAVGNEVEKLPARYIIKLDNTRVYAASAEDRLANLIRKYDETIVAASDEPPQNRVFDALGAAEITVTSAESVHELLKENDVALVEEVQLFRATGTLDRQRRQTSDAPSWGMDRVNQRTLPLDNIVRTEDDMKTSEGVTVFLVDSGVDYTHPEFEGRVVPAWSYFSTNGDGLGHGTHVAGILTSKTYGLSRATVMSVKVLADDGVGSTTTVMAGLNYVVTNFDRNKPTIVSMSLGGGFSQAMTEAINQITSYGLTVVAAAGNSNQNGCLYSPASAAAAITVGSTTNTDEKSRFSNYGQCLDILAPGTSIISTLPGGKTGPMSGTSMSVPHVTSAIAIYLGFKRSALPAEITSIILDNSTPGQATGFSDDTPNRMVYLEKSFLNPQPAPPPVQTTELRTLGPTSEPSVAPPPTEEPLVPTSTPEESQYTPPPMATTPPPVTTPPAVVTVQPPVTPTTSATPSPMETGQDPWPATSSAFQPPPTPTATTVVYSTWHSVSPAPTWQTTQVYKPLRCQCMTAQPKVVTSTWCRKYNGCRYFRQYCYCIYY